MTNHRTLRARARRALAAALAIVATSLLAAAPPAPASATDMKCNGDNGVSFNACLKFDPAGSSWWDAHVGIDVYMPEQYGREILACGAQFRASVWGDDGASGVSGHDHYISSLGIKPGWPAAGPTGIGAEFGAPIHGYYLDEDRGSDTDELYARVSYYDCHNGQTRSFVTGIVRGDFRT